MNFKFWKCHVRFVTNHPRAAERMELRILWQSVPHAQHICRAPKSCPCCPLNPTDSHQLPRLSERVPALSQWKWLLRWGEEHTGEQMERWQEPCVPWKSVWNSARFSVRAERGFGRRDKRGGDTGSFLRLFTCFYLFSRAFFEEQSDWSWFMTDVILIAASIRKAEINVSTAGFRSASPSACHITVSAQSMSNTTSAGT